MSDAPERIWAAPEGEYGQGFDAIRLATWSSKQERRDGVETQYVRADIAERENAELRAERDSLLKGHRSLNISGSRLEARAEDLSRQLAEARAEVVRLQTWDVTNTPQKQCPHDDINHVPSKRYKFCTKCNAEINACGFICDTTRAAVFPLEAKMRDLAGLIEKVEALEGPSREADAEICVTLQYGGLNSDGASNVRTDPDWEGDLLFEIEGDEHPECCNPIPELTASLDAAVALVERVLPGWSGDIDIGKPIADSGRVGARLFPPGDGWKNYAGDGPTPAIAIILALLRALSTGGRSDDR